MRRYSHYLALFLSLSMMAIIIIYREKIVLLGGYSYLGIFLISLVTTLTIVFPIPGWSLVVTTGAILNPVLVGLFSGIGGTIGEMNGYLLGYGGQMALGKAKHYEKIKIWMHSRGGLTLFVLALIPNPFFDLAGVAAGSLRYPVWKYLLYGGSGRLIKYIGYAYAGKYGLRLLMPD